MDVQAHEARSSITLIVSLTLTTGLAALVISHIPTEALADAHRTATTTDSHTLGTDGRGLDSQPELQSAPSGSPPPIAGVSVGGRPSDPVPEHLFRGVPTPQPQPADNARSIGSSAAESKIDRVVDVRASVPIKLTREASAREGAGAMTRIGGA